MIDARTEPHARVLDEIAGVVFSGGTVIFPTETVYGIGCDPFDSEAIAAIYGAKKRPANKPLTLHLATAAEFLEYAGNAHDAIAASRRLFPGPVTIIIRRPAFIPAEVSADLPTLGFRVPDDALCSALLDRCGPLAATSANTSGDKPYLGDGKFADLPAADLLVENGRTRYGAESTVLDLSGPAPRMLREGVVSYGRLSELLGPLLRYPVVGPKKP